MATHPLRFQVLTLPSAPWDEVLRRFKYVEELGFDMVTTGDHFVDWSEPSRPWLEAWTVLAAVARETTRIRLATYVTQIPLRNPALLARMALSVDQISGGRLEVGLGTGLRTDPATDMMGIPNWEERERVARFKEYVEVVDRMLSNEVTSYEGKYYTVRNAVMNPGPIQQPRPPIIVAALGRTMIKYAARYADNWNTMSFRQSFEERLEETRQRVEMVEEACAKAGRDPSTLRRSFLMFDPAARASGGVYSYYESTDAFSDQAGRLMELGFTELGLYFPLVEAQRPVFERIAQDVIPAMKRADVARTRAATTA